MKEMHDILHEKNNENESLKRQIEFMKSCQQRETENRIQEVEHHFIKKTSNIEKQAMNEVDYLKDKIRKLKCENERYFCENQRLIDMNKKLTNMLTENKLIMHKKDKLVKKINLYVPNSKELKKEVVETKRIADFSDYENDFNFNSISRSNSMNCNSSSISCSSAVFDDDILRERIGALENEIESLQSDVTLFS